MALLGLSSLGACSPQVTSPMKSMPASSEPDASLQHKFRAVRGGELRVDATFKVTTAVIVNVDTGHLFNIGMGVFGPGANSVSSYGGGAAGDRLPIPKHLRLILYPDGAMFLSRDKAPYFAGAPVTDVTVPLAERIPEETLDDLRQRGGTLRVKLRIHPETLLVGWDIARRPGYGAGNADASGTPILVPAQYSSVGGDFCEAVRFNGRVIQKGWYIDPRTRQRVETDY